MTKKDDDALRVTRAYNALVRELFWRGYLPNADEARALRDLARNPHDPKAREIAEDLARG